MLNEYETKLEEGIVTHIHTYTITENTEIVPVSYAMTHNNEHYINEIIENKETKFIDLKLGLVADTIDEIADYFEEKHGDTYKENIIDYVRDSYKYEVIKDGYDSFSSAFSTFAYIIDEDEVLSEDYFNSILNEDEIKEEFAKIYCMFNKEYIVENLARFDPDIDEFFDYDDLEDIELLQDLVRELKDHIFYGDEELLKNDVTKFSWYKETYEYDM